jgi:hypothetical protein
MSIYPSPRLGNGVLNTIFNNSDYIKDTGGSGVTLAQTDFLYLKNSGVVVSSANTTFNGTLNVGALATLQNVTTSGTLNVGGLATLQNVTTSGLLNAKQTTDTIFKDIWRSDPVFSITNGMDYGMISDATVVSSVRFMGIPTTVNQSYIFTFILQPSAVNSSFYIKPSSNNIIVNGFKVPLYGLQNVSLPSSYTYLVQQISIIYNFMARNLNLSL